MTLSKLEKSHFLQFQDYVTVMEVKVGFSGEGKWRRKIPHTYIATRPLQFKEKKNQSLKRKIFSKKFFTGPGVLGSANVYTCIESSLKYLKCYEETFWKKNFFGVRHRF